jgi:5-methylcytosine-specific restriction protein A
VTGPDDPLFYDPDNHQPLCASHHGRKTAKENGGFGNKPRQNISQK